MCMCENACSACVRECMYEPSLYCVTSDAAEPRGPQEREIV